MPDQTLDQLPQEIQPDDADLVYVVRNGADRKLTRAVLVGGLAPAARTVAAGPGLAGGGDLTANRTLSLDIAGLTEDTAPVATADFALVLDTSTGLPRKVRLDRLPGGAGGGATPTVNAFTSVAVDGQTTLVADGASDVLTISAGANIAIATNATTDTMTIAATGLVPAARTVGAGNGLTGGGDLTANRALALNIPGQSEDTAPNLNNHYLITHDSAVGALRKIRASLLSGGTYVLPVASAGSLGGVRVGGGLAIDVNGLLSATYALPTASASVLGGVKVGPGLAIDSAGILRSAPPTASATTAGVVRVGEGLEADGEGLLSVKIGAGLTMDGAGTLSAAPFAVPIATTLVAGVVKVGSGLAIDGTGLLSATATGSGSGGGTFASVAEAQAGVSATTYMSPARTKDAITAYTTANELSGTEGQVVGFSATGAAVAIKNTRVVMVPCVAESTALAASPNVRKFRMPIGLRLTAVEFYTPTVGTSASTFDVNLNGSSIFAAAPTLAANTAAATVTAFATATLPKGGIVDFDVDAAGAGARGLWVSLSGTEA